MIMLQNLSGRLERETTAVGGPSPEEMRPPGETYAQARCSALRAIESDSVRSRGAAFSIALIPMYAVLQGAKDAAKIEAGETHEIP